MIFRFNYDEGSNMIFAKTPTTNMLIENGACKQNDVFRICITKANYTDKNITTWVFYYTLGVDIYKLTGSLTDEPTLTKNKIYQGERTSFTMKIENPTDFEISGIDFTINLSTLNFGELRGCTLNETQMIWRNGVLKPRHDKLCTIELFGFNEGKYPFSGIVRYYNGLEKEEIKTTSIELEVLPKQLDADQFIDSNVEINMPFHFNISVQNINLEQRLETTMQLDFPAGLHVLEYPDDLVKDAGQYRMARQFEPNTGKNYSFHLVANSKESMPVKSRITYYVGNIYDVIENSTYIDPLEPAPLIEFIPETIEPDFDQKFVFLAKIRNPSIYYTLKKIKGTLDAPYNGKFYGETGSLSPNGSYSIISQTLVFPNDLKDVIKNDIEVRLDIDYEFENALKSTSKSMTLKLKGVESPQPEQQAGQEIPIEQQTKQEAPAEQQKSIIEVIEEQPKVENIKNNWMFGAVAFAAVIALTLLIHLIKGRKGNPPSQQFPPQQGFNN